MPRPFERILSPGRGYTETLLRCFICGFKPDAVGTVARWKYLAHHLETHLVESPGTKCVCVLCGWKPDYKMGGNIWKLLSIHLEQHLDKLINKPKKS